MSNKTAFGRVASNLGNQAVKLARKDELINKILKCKEGKEELSFPDTVILVGERLVLIGLIALGGAVCAKKTFDHQNSSSSNHPPSKHCSSMELE